MVKDVILLVEDNAQDAFIMTMALRKAGIKNPLENVENAIEAIHYLDGEGKYSNRALYPLPALMLISSELRLVSGLEVLRWVRRQAHLRDLRIVLLSDFPLSDDELAGFPPIVKKVVKPGGFGDFVSIMAGLAPLLGDQALLGGESRRAA